MNINFRKFRESDREDYLRMANSFYSPPAVLHKPDEAVFIANFNEALKPDGRLIAYIVEAALAPATARLPASASRLSNSRRRSAA